MIVFYITCAFLIIITLGAITTNIYERLVDGRPRTPPQRKEDDWKTYKPR